MQKLMKISLVVSLFILPQAVLGKCETAPEPGKQYTKCECQEFKTYGDRGWKPEGKKFYRYVLDYDPCSSCNFGTSHWKMSCKAAK